MHYHFSIQVFIPDIGRVQPSGSWQISSTVPDGLLVVPYIAMYDRLMLFPHDDVSTVVWDLENDRRAGLLEVHDCIVTLAAVPECGSIAATYSYVGDVAKIWSLDTMQCKATLTSAGIASMCCLKDRLFLGSREGPIKVWDISVSTPVALLDLQGHEDAVWNICASETHNVVLSGSNDESMRLWDVRTGGCVRTMRGHTGEVKSVDMDSACRTGVSGSCDKTVKTWDLGTGKCIDTFHHERAVRSVGLHETGSSFFSLDADNCLNLFATADAGKRENKTVDLKAVCGLSAQYAFTMRVAANKDLSCIATSYINDSTTNGNRLVTSMMWQ